VGFIRPTWGVFCTPGLLCIVVFSSYIIEQYKYLVCDIAEISEKELCLKKFNLLASLRNIVLNGQFAGEVQTLI